MGWGKRLSGFFAVICIGILILDSHTAFSGALQGIDLCLRTVLPSLFPLLFFSSILTSSFSGEDLRVLRPVAWAFRFPKGTEALILPSFLGGYPVGAQGIACAWSQGILDLRTAERMLAFGNNAGPAFLFGMLAFQFSGRQTLWQIWGIQLLSAWVVSRFFPLPALANAKAAPSKASEQPLDTALKAVGKISGWIVLFRVLIAFLERRSFQMLPTPIRVLFTGLLELSNGCCMLNQIPDETIRFVIANSMLAFGGVCVIFQTISVCRPLRIRYYLYGKTLQAVTAALLAWVLRSCTLLFRLS